MTDSQPRRRITTLAPPRQSWLLPWRTGALLVMLLVTLLIASPALSALRIGTSAGETLTGTTGNDHITGAQGIDTLRGLAGNDTYFFADGWGADTLTEKPGKGTDTLNFRGVTGSGLFVGVVREWAATNSVFFAAFGPVDETVSFTSGTTIEKVLGGPGNNDAIHGGVGANTLMPGGGSNDTLQDFGGGTTVPAGAQRSRSATTPTRDSPKTPGRILSWTMAAAT